MYYSIAHDWQGDTSIKQVLVFANVHDRDNFDRVCIRKANGLVPSTDMNSRDQDVKGVFVKLRAVLDSDNAWISIIRTADGSLIKEYDELFQTWEEALQHAKFRMMLPNL